MDVGISTRCFGTAPLTLDLLERLRRANFTRIELHAALPGLDYHNRSLARDVARWFRENELPAPSLHLPFEKDVLTSSRFDRQAALDELKRCLEFSDLLELQFAVLHLGEPRQEFNPVALEYAYAAVATVQSFSGVHVLLETLPNDIATFSRIEEFRNAAQLPNVGICYDTGHGEVDGTCDAIHLNDNHGTDERSECKPGRAQPSRDDEHLWPFDGNRNWPALAERLVLSSFAGPMILEVRDDRLEKASGCRSRLRDLMDEAANSMEEFRLKYKLPVPQLEEDEKDER